MNIFDIIFGKKKTIKHPILGELVSDRIRGNNQTKTYTWIGSITLSNKPEQTTIIMEGNSVSPCSSHLTFLNQLVSNWENEYLPKIEGKISEKGIDKIEKFSNWKNNFYVGQITPMNEQKPEFELTFEPLNSESSDFIGIEFKNNNVSKVEIHE